MVEEELVLVVFVVAWVVGEALVAWVVGEALVAWVVREVLQVH